MFAKINFGSLFWKLVLPIVVLFVASIIALGLYIPQQIGEQAVAGAASSSIQTAKQFKILRKYYVQNILNKVTAGSDMKPAINHKDNPNAFPLPATMIHDLSALLKDEGTTVNLYSAYPFPNRKSRVLDSFQNEAWDFLVKNPKSVYVKKALKNGKAIVRVAVADTMVTQGCVGCHNSHPDTPRTGWKLGDVRGVLEINSDISEQISASTTTAAKIIFALVITLLVIIATIYYIYKTVIARKLMSLDNSINELATGSSDLTKRLDESGKDEISSLARGFNKFLENHRVFIKDITEAAHQLSESSAQMSGITTQAKQDAAEQSARNAKDETSIGSQVIEENIRITNTLSDEIKNAADVIQELKADSEGIGSVLDVIRGVSEQTNLLALNAAIEAARAGEHGRGFAVVADEVRTLASKTQESTVEIQEMIEKLQHGADNAVTVMSKGIETVNASVQQATQTGTTLKSITETVTGISDINSLIATAVEEQSVVAEDINKNIVTVDDLAQRGEDASNNIASANQQLNDLAENLSNQVSQFKI